MKKDYTSSTITLFRDNGSYPLRKDGCYPIDGRHDAELAPCPAGLDIDN